MITAKLLREWDACWNDERIAGHLAGREAVSPRAVASDASISLDDRLWVLCRTLWYLDERAARLFEVETALEVAHLAGDEDDQAQFCGLMNELILVEDLPEDQRAAAWDAAWAAARAATWAATREKSIARAIEWLGDFADGWEDQ